MSAKPFCFSIAAWSLALALSSASPASAPRRDGGSLSNDPISQEAYIKAFNTNEGDVLARSIAADGDTMVVGAIGESSNGTGVNGNNNNNAPCAGAAYVFVRGDSGWQQVAYLKASNTETGDQFGFDVAISGDVIVVGAPFEDSSATGIDGDQDNNQAANAGAAYVFVRNGTTWSQVAYLKASNTDSSDYFGSSVDVSGGTIIVGALLEDSSATGVNGNQTDNSAPVSGAAYIFERVASGWHQQAYLKASNTGAEDFFGDDVAIDADTAVVGAPWERSDATGVNGDEDDDSFLHAGAAYVFARHGASWTQESYLKASNTDREDRFGVAVSITGNRVTVAAPYEGSSATGVNGDESDNSMTQSGAVYVFRREGSTWQQEAYLKASNTDAGDWFGTAVDLSDDHLVVGALFEMSWATGVNGDQNSNNWFRPGAAYWFERSGTRWTQRAYLKASNAQTMDSFGRAVAVTGRTIVVGADDEDSCATGLNGEQYLIDNCFASGAVYAFEIATDSSVAAFCFGNSCPCGNDTPRTGCVNGTGAGALLTVSGSTQVALDDFILTAQSLPPDEYAVAFMGSERTSLPFGNGVLCVSGNTFHFPPQSTGAAGSVSLGPGIAFESCNLFGAPGCIVAGSTWVFQTSYRDTFGPCGAGFNTSNAVSIAFSP